MRARLETPTPMKMPRLTLLGVLILGGLPLTLAGCSTPATVGTGSGQAYPSSAARTIFVSRGETAYDIAQRYNVPLRDLIEENRLSPPYALTPGQALRLPVPQQYVVQAGDTIYGLSRRYAVDMNELVRMNGIQPPYMIQVGQSLRLPGGRGGAAGTQMAAAPSGPVAAGPAPAAVPRSSVQAVPLDPAPSAAPAGVQRQPLSPPAPQPSAGVQPSAPAGRTPARGVETAELAPLGGAAQSPSPAAPPVQAPAQPQSQPPTQPQRIAPTPAPVTPGSREPAHTPSPPPATAPVRTQPDSAAVSPAPRPPAQQAQPEPQPAAPVDQQAALPSLPPAQPQAAAPRPATPAPAPRSSGRFLWPVQGQVLSDFGPKPGGLYNDGINIGAPQGTPVAAAENGVVVYAGNELKGYGNLILIRHAEGWLTAYAHLEAMEVDRGQEVRRGQRIGTVGRTGNVRTPQLHFGIRRNEKAIDPKEHLGGPGS